jgi:hypothetical protein
MQLWKELACGAAMRRWSKSLKETWQADAPFVSNLVREMARGRQNVHEPSPSLSGRGFTNDDGDEWAQMAILVDSLGLGR